MFGHSRQRVLKLIEKARQGNMSHEDTKALYKQLTNDSYALQKLAQAIKAKDNEIIEGLRHLRATLKRQPNDPHLGMNQMGALVAIEKALRELEQLAEQVRKLARRDK